MTGIARRDSVRVPSSLGERERAAVLAWYDARGRSMAFRSSRDPYAILVSEVMAQQTQISRVVPAWRRFLTRFPTLDALAAGSPADVLREWQGLGYDRRALNLRRAAIAIRDLHGSRVPSTVVELQQLPGVGPYTARAVAAIAFGMPVGAVDTNVRRVLTRVLALETRADGARSDAAGVQAAADASVDPWRPADWTHALMDLGATTCRPRRPHCEACPLANACQSRESPDLMPHNPGPVPGADVVGVSPTVPRDGRQRREAPTRKQPFDTTTRWLRGRIVDRLRVAPGESWTRVEGPIGRHDPEAVSRALAALARDGVVELDPLDRQRARLATA